MVIEFAYFAGFFFVWWWVLCAKLVISNIDETTYNKTARERVAKKRWRIFFPTIYSANISFNRRLSTLNPIENIYPHIAHKKKHRGNEWNYLYEDISLISKPLTLQTRKYPQFQLKLSSIIQQLSLKFPHASHLTLYGTMSRCSVTKRKEWRKHNKHLFSLFRSVEFWSGQKRKNWEKKLNITGGWWWWCYGYETAMEWMKFFTTVDNVTDDDWRTFEIRINYLRFTAFCCSSPLSLLVNLKWDL